MSDEPIIRAFPDAYRRLGDDAVLLTEIARILVEDAPGLLDQIREGIRQSNFELVASTTHALKGLVANVDENICNAAVQPVIDAARSRSMDQTRRLFRELEPALGSLVQSIKAYL
jgi:hypothetical protein